MKDSRLIDNVAYDLGDHIYMSESLENSLIIHDTYVTTKDAKSPAVYANNI